jgi:hypothetical protein
MCIGKTDWQWQWQYRERMIFRPGLQLVFSGSIIILSTAARLYQHLAVLAGQVDESFMLFAGMSCPDAVYISISVMSGFLWLLFP